jgi:hypothetical protein
MHVVVLGAIHRVAALRRGQPAGCGATRRCGDGERERACRHRGSRGSEPWHAGAGEDVEPCVRVVFWNRAIAVEARSADSNVAITAPALRPASAMRKVVPARLRRNIVRTHSHVAPMSCPFRAGRSRGARVVAPTLDVSLSGRRCAHILVLRAIVRAGPSALRAHCRCGSDSSRGSVGVARTFSCCER